MLYLDNSATTKILPEVLEAMIPYLSEYYGNPNSKYYAQALETKKAVDLARHQIAMLLNCLDDEILFTSGSTESNNFILKGYVDANVKLGKHIIISSIEHASILNTAKFLESKGIDVTYLPVDGNGFINIDDLIKSIKKETILVSIMWSNNELGSINDIKKISEICHKNKILFHSDATQIIGKIPIDLSEFIDVDFLSFSAHKFYGPKGIGGVFIRKDKNGFYPPITPLLHGGEQEYNLRAGTLAVHQIVGMGKAAEIATLNMTKNLKKLEDYEKEFINRMKKVFGEKIIINNNFSNKIPGLISLRILGYNNQLFLKNASSLIAASTGSACSNAKPSYVLKACGYNDEEIRETIRFSLSAYDDYDHFNSIE